MTTFIGALEAVLELHAKTEYGECSECSHWISDDQVAAYPCATVRTIQEALS